ncbi:MAG: hypothetical protein ABW006_08610 [Hyphomicrobium sp.]
MRFKAITVLLGAVVASSFSAPVKFGAAGPADAADAIPPPPQQAVRVPEFVPVMNFSEFVLAMQAFAAQNPPASRIAAEALSAKFAANADGQKVEFRKAEVEAAAPAIITRQVAVASVRLAVEASPEVANVPSVPDPGKRSGQALADPVKIASGHVVAKSSERRHKAENKVASANRPRGDKHLPPAMGLGMVIESAEDAPPMSSLAPKKRTPPARSQDIE